jgi:hypothetical protein
VVVFLKGVMRRGALIAVLVLALLAPFRDALATPCTLVALDKPENAKIKVYFTKFVKEDNSGGKYKACKIVKKPEADSVTFFVTPFRQDATVVVHHSNWPG